MTQHDPQSNPDAEREALATLVARFSADRDRLASAVEHCERSVADLTGRVDAAAARAGAATPADALDSVRERVERLAAGVETLTGEVAHLRARVEQDGGADDDARVLAFTAAIDEVRGQVERLRGDAARHADVQAERVLAAALAAVAAERGALETMLDALRAEVGVVLDELRRGAAGAQERAAGALAQLADQERRLRDAEGVRPMLLQLREDLLHRVEEIEVRLGVRLDAIMAGAEAESRTMRDALWDRLAVVEQLARAAGETQTAGRSDADAAAERTARMLAALSEQMDHLGVELDAAGERLQEVEAAQRQAPPPGLLACVRDEVVAAVMMLASLGAVAARLPGWLGR